MQDLLYLRQSNVSKFQFVVIEKLMEHDIHCLPCSYTNDVIDLLLWQLGLHIDFKVTSEGCFFVKVLSTTVVIPYLVW